MTEASDQLARIGLLSRQNKGRKQLSTFLQGLSRAVGDTIGPDSLSGLTVTDDVTRAFEQQYQSSIRSPATAFMRSFRAGTENDLYRLLACMAEKLRDDDTMLITKLSEICGAVRLKVDRALLHARHLLAFDGDSLALLSRDGESGLLLDYRDDDLDATYELTVFGKVWLNAVARCEGQP